MLCFYVAPPKNNKVLCNSFSFLSLNESIFLCVQIGKSCVFRMHANRLARLKLCIWIITFMQFILSSFDGKRTNEVISMSMP